VPLAPDVDVKRATAALTAWPFDGLGFETIRGALVGGSAPTRARLKTEKPLPRPEVAQALAGPGLARLALVPTTDTPRILEK